AGIAFSGGEANQILTGPWVCWAALAVEQHTAVIVLGIGVALCSGTTIPEASKRLVLRETFVSGGIEAAKIALGHRRSEFGSTNEQGSPTIVLWRAEVRGIAEASKVVIASGWSCDAAR